MYLDFEKKRKKNFLERGPTYSFTGHLITHHTVKTA